MIKQEFKEKYQDSKVVLIEGEFKYIETKLKSIGYDIKHEYMSEVFMYILRDEIIFSNDLDEFNEYCLKDVTLRELIDVKIEDELEDELEVILDNMIKIVSEECNCKFGSKNFIKNKIYDRSNTDIIDGIRSNLILKLSKYKEDILKKYQN